MKKCNALPGDSFAQRLCSALLAVGVVLAAPAIASAEGTQPEEDPLAAEPVVEEPAVEATTAPAPEPSSAPPEAYTDFIRKTVTDVPKSLELHGYMRSGFGINNKGGDQEAFKAPGVPYKWRLGNEIETYGEAILVNNWINPERDGAWFKTEVLLAFITGNNSNVDDTVLTFREAFAQAGGVVESMPEAKFWAGQRYYRRHDVHINDFFFLDMSGYGGGVEDIAVGLGKLHVAYLGGSRDDLVSEAGRMTQSNIDIRLSDIEAAGSVTGWLNLAKNSDYADPMAGDIDGAWGVAVGALHTRGGIMGGANKLAVQFGIGAASDFNTFIAPEDPGSWQFRIIEQLQIQPSETLSMMGALVVGMKNDGFDDAPTTAWFSVGARPIWHATKYLSVAAEAGLDFVTAGDISAPLFKFTVAPQIATGNSFWSRPVLRAYATMATWGDDFTGLVGGAAFANDNLGMAFGVQAESWW